MKGYKLKRGMSYFARSFLFSFFSRCGRFIGRKIFPFCLCLLFLVGSFSLSSYAAEYTNLINSQQFSSWQRDIVSGSAPTLTYASSTGNKVDYANKNNSNIVLYSSVIDGIVPSDNYQFSFDWMGWGARMPFVAYIDLLDISGNIINSAAGNFEASTNITEWQTVSCNFKPSDVISGSGNPHSVRLRFAFSPLNSYDKCWINIRNIKLIDTDEDVETGLLEGIKDWLSRVYHSIAGGIDSQGVNHQGIVAGITSAINNIQSWLTNVRDGIVNGLTTVLNNVKTAITNAIAGIQQWFIDLKDNIINGLKSLFIPSDGYFSGKMTEMDTWLTAHFGALYQGPQLGVEFVRQIFNFTPNDNFTITVPNFEFDFMGEHYVLSAGSSLSFAFVNDSQHPLHNFYVFYRAFVTIILFFMFFTYLKNKYLQIFNNGVGVDDS